MRTLDNLFWTAADSAAGNERLAMRHAMPPTERFEVDMPSQLQQRRAIFWWTVRTMWQDRPMFVLAGAIGAVVNLLYWPSLWFARAMGLAL